MMVPVGPTGAAPSGCRGCDQMQMPSTDNSGGGNSPVPGSAGFVVPPPPEFQPELERVPSTSGPAPCVSPSGQWSSQGGGLAASLNAAVAQDEAANRPPPWIQRCRRLTT